jgi:hypothetical protein
MGVMVWPNSRCLGNQVEGVLVVGNERHFGEAMTKDLETSGS